jgi:hypothetical protein
MTDELNLEVHISKETNSCDFGWEKNRIDVVKSGGITQIDDMAWEKKNLDGFRKKNLL